VPENLKKLEDRVQSLIAACDRLTRENRSLKEENVRLRERTQAVRSRVETMIGRLKALERSA
jgi:cell division protein ZapB